jgi:thioredoxin 1
MSEFLQEATPENFDELVFGPRDQLVVVDFWGPDCPNCEYFAQEAPLLLEQLRGAALRVVKVNAYEHLELARRFGLHGIPTFLLGKDGKLIGKMSQYYGREYWLGVIRDHLPSVSHA